MTNGELLEWEQELIAEEEAREKETAGVEKEEPLRKFTMKGFTEAFANLYKLLKKFGNMDPNIEIFSLIEWNVNSVLSAYKKICDGKRNKLSKPPWIYF